MSSVPALVAHADWSTHPKKRWMAVAVLVGDTYVLSAPELVGDTASLLTWLQCRSQGRQFVVGFDFPVGVPIAYAEKVGIKSFVEELPKFGSGQWAMFYELARSADEISPWRPFYPYGTGGMRQQHLLDGLGMHSMQELLRVCDHGVDRPAACSLFWTLGAKQVGRAAINGWREVLAPALAQSTLPVAMWPFHGELRALLRTSECILVETYPAEAGLHLGLSSGFGKRNQRDRQCQGLKLLSWAESRDEVSIVSGLESMIRDGFSPKPEGEDPFDAVVGLMSMLEVILGYRTDGAAGSPAPLHVEGWILGRHPEACV